MCFWFLLFFYLFFVWGVGVGSSSFVIARTNFIFILKNVVPYLYFTFGSLSFVFPSGWHNDFTTKTPYSQTLNICKIFVHGQITPLLYNAFKSPHSQIILLEKISKSVSTNLIIIKKIIPDAKLSSEDTSGDEQLFARAERSRMGLLSW